MSSLAPPAGQCALSHGATSAHSRANPPSLWRCLSLPWLGRLGRMRANPRATPCHQHPPLGIVADRGPHHSINGDPDGCQALYQAQESGHQQVTQESGVSQIPPTPRLSTRNQDPVCPDFPSDQAQEGLPWPSLCSEAIGRMEGTAEGDHSRPAPRAAGGTRKLQEEGSSPTSHCRTGTGVPWYWPPWSLEHFGLSGEPGLPRTLLLDASKQSISPRALLPAPPSSALSCWPTVSIVRCHRALWATPGLPHSLCELPSSRTLPAFHSLRTIHLHDIQDVETAKEMSLFF